MPIYCSRFLTNDEPDQAAACEALLLRVEAGLEKVFLPDLVIADTALRFGKFFGNSADFWLGIQMEYDLRKEKVEIECVLEKIEEYH